jgi:hypothetical protein
MCFTVDFDDQLRGMAVEISDIGIRDLLPPSGRLMLRRRLLARRIVSRDPLSITPPPRFARSPSPEGEDQSTGSK